MPHDPLDRRLRRSGVLGTTDPLTAWHRLRDFEGQRVTVIELYQLAGRQRGCRPRELPLAERRELARQVLPRMFPGFELSAEAPRPPEPVEIVPCDRRWPARFRSWRLRIAAVMGPTAQRIDHVGSTAVPGLAARPVVDLQVSVPDLEAEAMYVPQLLPLGQRLASRDRDHRYLRPPADRPREVHVHVCVSGSEWERNHLLFRDFLRARQAARRRYEMAKREAARVWDDDRLAYTDAKSGVILDLLAGAESWAAAGAGGGQGLAAGSSVPGRQAAGK